MLVVKQLNNLQVLAVLVKNYCYLCFFCMCYLCLFFYVFVGVYNMYYVFVVKGLNNLQVLVVLV
jgi:hypothetical protein